MNQVFFHNIIKKKQIECNNEFIQKKFEETNENVMNINSPQLKNIKKIKLYPINEKNLEEKNIQKNNNNYNYNINNNKNINKNINKNNNFSSISKSLNNELSRISNIYGKDKSLNKFVNNPNEKEMFNNDDYNHYEMAKIKQLGQLTGKKLKPKLKPLICREPAVHKMSQSLFLLNENKKAINK